ncbi:hypothetical protein RhiirA5_431438 [Rhizophagus irregularis]|uniref:Uncharacterized protein n=1 Tax=Rhizophagus irregularis TaxID=588596 RepID=A0A2N0NV39_9GLOM|nr:hypothetical protein RhiirA5_431438 [Rhizophagus irregularis]
MFSKSSDSTLDKATLLTTTFSEGSDPKYFAEQSKATNIQPITLSLIMSIASYAVAAGGMPIKWWTSNYVTDYFKNWEAYYSNKASDSTSNTSNMSEEEKEKTESIASQEIILKKLYSGTRSLSNFKPFVSIRPFQNFFSFPSIRISTLKTP